MKDIGGIIVEIVAPIFTGGVLIYVLHFLKTIEEFKPYSSLINLSIIAIIIGVAITEVVIFKGLVEK